MKAHDHQWYCASKFGPMHTVRCLVEGCEASAIVDYLKRNCHGCTGQLARSRFPSRAGRAAARTGKS